ncbi:hypothetical protein [Alteromonas gilva]|uniref:Uncharacterized protein n=1 Tax=Alteromonas gilva TaxID=2987522 RepID=A0ABT5L1S3_9ALTE|nr:hypothetical protein [Alteromonas gilva]MDC8830986.1 hypothetical protein [Alteromonas gilva]
MLVLIDVVRAINRFVKSKVTNCQPVTGATTIDTVCIGKSQAANYAKIFIVEESGGFTIDVELSKG